MRKICLAILLVPALAWAQPKTAAEWYKEGENQYLLGNFDKAVEAFKQGFSLETDGSKRAAYLYNVAQSYRQANDCGHALFFYKRFLALKEGDTVRPLSAQKRKEVGDWITELEKCVQQATAVGKKPPNTNLPPDGEASDRVPPPAETERKDPPRDPVATASAASADGSGTDDEDHGETPEPSLFTGPRVFSARLTAGATKVSAGDLEIPVQFTLALTGGYPIAINDKLTVDVGAAFTFTPVPDHIERPSMLPADRMVRVIGLMANVDARYEVFPRFELRGDVGVGALFLTNVSGTKFTDGRPTDGALSMFHVRPAASADYAFTRNLIGVATVAFTYSPAKSGLEESIENITSFDFMLGIGYQM